MIDRNPLRIASRVAWTGLGHAYRAGVDLLDRNKWSAYKAVASRAYQAGQASRSDMKRKRTPSFSAGRKVPRIQGRLPRTQNRRVWGPIRRTPYPRRQLYIGSLRHLWYRTPRWKSRFYVPKFKSSKRYISAYRARIARIRSRRRR